MHWTFADCEQAYSSRDTILYALSVGFGSDPLADDELPFVYEEHLRATPTMATILGNPGPWLRDPATGIDLAKVVHGEQGLEVFRPLPATGTIIGRTRVEEVVDKGSGRDAVLYTALDLFDQRDGSLLSTLRSTRICRGAGGFGGPEGRTSPPPAPVPDRPPDATSDMSTLPQAALLYRLNGDLNPLHVSPAAARVAGFPRPILHGLCTFGMAGRAALRTLCGYDGTRLTRLAARFSAPVYPGETLRFETWLDQPGRAVFRCVVVERDVVAISNGVVEYRPEPPSAPV